VYFLGENGGGGGRRMSSRIERISSLSLRPGHIYSSILSLSKVIGRKSAQ
jgi:hypothetical protein